MEERYINLFMKARCFTKTVNLLSFSVLQLASVQCNVPKGEKNFKLYSKETLEEIIAQIKK